MKKLASLTSVIALATTGERTPTPAAVMAAVKRLTLTARSEVSGAIAKAIGQAAPLAAVAERDDEAEAECDEEIVRRLSPRWYGRVCDRRAHERHRCRDRSGRNGS